MLKTFHHKLLLLQIILHLLAVVGLFYYWNLSWLLVSLLGKYIFANLGLEIGYHRLLSHRSFKTSTAIENVLSFLGIYGGFGPSLTWTANHRVHHKHSDRDGDPHPANDTWKTLFWLNDKVAVNPGVVKDLLRNPFHKWMRDNYFKIWYTTLAVSAILFGPQFTLYFFVIPGASGILSGAAINIMCHKFGYRNFKTQDQSTNNWWVNLYATFGGSGWHNNHHANPGSYTTKVKWWEWDLDGWVIKYFLRSTT
jgi:stearoyl-CoA desaturase (delta-9 desaturase)